MLKASEGEVPQAYLGNRCALVQMLGTRAVYELGTQKPRVQASEFKAGEENKKVKTDVWNSVGGFLYSQVGRVKSFVLLL